jgi:hypothetical protein
MRKAVNTFIGVGVEDVDLQMVNWLVYGLKGDATTSGWEHS